MIRRLLVTLFLAAASVLPGTATGAATPVFQDQISSGVVPLADVQQAADVWGVTLHYGGPPSCHEDGTICMGDLPATWAGLPGRLLGETVGQAIVISPAVLSRSHQELVFVIAHELGNALGVPEQPCGAHSVMSRCWDGYLQGAS